MGRRDLDSDSYPLTKAENREVNGLFDRIEEQRLGSNMSRVLILVANIQGGCSVFTTKKNRFGYIRGHVMSGDQVCLFDGAPFFYIIRKCNTGGSDEKYELTGEAYVHKAMHGEVEALGLESYDITLV